MKTLYKLINPKYQKLILDYKVDMKPRNGHGKPPNALQYSIINANRSTYKNFIQLALTHQHNIAQIKDQARETSTINPVWNNGYLPGLDIIGIYTMIAHFQPKTYIEVGSGNSTKVVHKAKLEQNLTTEIISIDPYPRAEIDTLAQQVIRLPLENIDLTVFNQLQENDIVFIDNSHRVLPNSDATVVFMEILPLLSKGVVVHIHDIYLSYDYPQFMCDRFYSEQYCLAAFIMANPQKYFTIFPSYFIAQDAELSNELSSFWQLENLRNVEQHGGSYWLKIME